MTKLHDFARASQDSQELRLEVRQKGSHLVMKCGECTTIVPNDPGEDIGAGLLRAIEKQLAPCLGPNWLK